MTFTQHPIFLFNTLRAEKEIFKPLVENYVGMYVCGPTVYSDVHMGNCRTFVSFDLLYRLFLFMGYKVRYVRNITDVGHLLGDVDTGSEDKIGKKARLMQLQPMEIVQKYTIGFHNIMHQLNNLSPNIEPTATGHIIEQIEMVAQILENGFAYEMNGSVYFDTIKHHQSQQNYGHLSGRILEELIIESRDDLKNQNEKKHPSDFALWIKADESHLMKWASPWSIGFPGWHLECSAMSTKYLGKTFDIHGGGQDLKFPHHENEIAQNHGACHCNPSNYWMHTNMLLMNGKKMSKSDGNSILPQELFSGENSSFPRPFSPMIVRFFMLQSHYRSNLDLTYEGCLLAEKNYNKIKDARILIKKITYQNNHDHHDLNIKLQQLYSDLIKNMCDDLNTPKALSNIYEASSIINALYNNQIVNGVPNLLTKEIVHDIFVNFIENVWGILFDSEEDQINMSLTNNLMDLILEMRANARTKKDWESSDFIRERLSKINIQIKDEKEKITWSYEN